MELGSAVETLDDSAMTTGIVAVCLFHLGVGALTVLGSLLLLVFSPLIAVFGVIIGLILLAIGYGLMRLRARAWYRAIGFHAIDIAVGVGLLLSGELRSVVGIAVSVAIIASLYSQRRRYLDSA